MFLILPSNFTKRLLIYTLLFLSLVAYSQSNASSLLDSLSNNVELSKKSGEGLANAYLQLGNHNIIYENFSSAIPILKNAFEVGQATGDSITWVRSFGSLGYAHNMSGESKIAFQYYLQGMNAADSLNMEKLQARYLWYLGDYFSLQGQFEPAIEYLEKAGALYDKLSMKGPWCRSYLLSLADVYSRMFTEEGNQTAIAHYQQLLSVECEEGLNESERAIVYNKLGEIYISKKQYQIAEEYVFKALEILRKGNIPSRIVHSLHVLAELNQNKGNLKAAKIYIEEAYDIAKNGENIYALFNVTQAAGDINKALGNYKEAAENLTISNSIRDSVEILKRVEVIAELELKYKTAQKEEALANQELQLKNQELALQLQQNRIQGLIGWGSFILALLGVFFIWNRYKFKLQKKEARNLEKLDQLKTRYFTNISHELRTPLSLILDPLNQLKNLKNQPKEQKLIKIASKNAERMLHLVNQMLDLGKLEAGKLPLKAQARDLKLSLSVIVDSFKGLAAQRKINLNFTSETNELAVYVDPDKVEKIISNLLANALKFTDAGGSISVFLLKRNQHAEIHIKDTGTGIPADKLPFIFDRFYQADDSETRSFEGTGIGLSLVKELVELHHGSVAAKSQEGKGTQVIIQLPLGKDHLKKSEIVHPTHAPLELDPMKKTVHLIGEKNAILTPPISSTDTENEVSEKPILLIVEDHQDLRDYIVQQFQSDYQILEAANGMEGEEMAMERIPDLIISDVMMPGMNGYDLCERIKKDERSAHIPIILLTAKSTPENKLHGLKKQADDYLIKPFDSEELRIRVSNLITQRKQLRAKFSQSKYISPKDITVNSVDQIFLENLLAIIEENMSNENFAVEEMSKSIGMSRSQLHRKLKALTGQSASIFLRNIRLKRAYQLLEQSAGNASEIAFQVGFSNPNYFFKCFKATYSLTPGQVLNGEKAE